jgi:hypothetical protein
MHRIILCTLVIALLPLQLSRGQGSSSQPSKKEEKVARPSSLDELIGQALKGNPDIRVAESKVREAEAELSRTRMKVVSDVTLLSAEIQAAQALVDFATKQYERTAQAYKSGTLAEKVYRESLLALEKAKGDLASKQAKLPYLLGKQVSKADHSGVGGLLQEFAKTPSDAEFFRRTMLDMSGRLPTPAEIQEYMKAPEKERRQKWIDHLLQSHGSPRDSGMVGATGCVRCHDKAVRVLDTSVIGHWLLANTDSPMSDKVRKALDTPIKLVLEKNSVNDALEAVRRHVPGVNVMIRYKSDRRSPGSTSPEPASKTLSADFSAPIPLGGYIQFLEDELGCTFILRDYGIVVVNADEKLPPGAVRVLDFWKHAKTVDSTKKLDPNVTTK